MLVIDQTLFLPNQNPISVLICLVIGGPISAKCLVDLKIQFGNFILFCMYMVVEFYLSAADMPVQKCLVPL